MSGPKCSGFELEQRLARERLQAEEIQRQADEQRRQEELRRIREITKGIALESQRLEEVKRALAEAIVKFPGEPFPQEVAVPAMPELLSSIDLQAHMARLQLMASSAQSEFRLALERAMANKNVRDIIGQASAHITDESRSLSEWLSDLDPKEIKTDGKAAQDNETIGRLLSRLGDVPCTEEIQRLSDSLLSETNEQRAALLELTLRQAIQDARKMASKQRVEQQEAEELLLSLPTIEMAETAQVRTDLQRVACGLAGLDEELRRRVVAIRQSAERRMLDSCAGEIAQTVLRDLGYETNESFSTLFVEGGELFFQRPGWNEYFGSVLVDHESQRMTLRIVRDSTVEPTTEQTRRDVEMERSWCDQHRVFMKALSTAGLKTTGVSAVRAGAVDVEVLDLSAAGRERRSGRRSASRVDKSAAHT